MDQISFAQLGLIPEIKRAIDEMGFQFATDIQAQAIPLIQNGYDVIGRSQTGTGKTVAFGIPALSCIDTTQDFSHHPQVLILCPTRELAVQACSEIRKLAKYLPGIKAADVYGGAPMDRQIASLRRANIVVGTPGRVMDHMRRKTLRLELIKMVVLDEADEMLSMGFREDIETILQDTPDTRQTVLFSATMPKSILDLTKQYQNEPQTIAINQAQITVENIEQSFYDLPMGRKLDGLNLLLLYHQPRLAIVFCNTKKMVDDVTEFLNKKGFRADGLHGDLKQSQRDKVMGDFKRGNTNILVATDVAARGIDVNDVEYVINYDIPQNTEYYVHRIGRTGRAGKSGTAITLCSGRRQVQQLLVIVKAAKTQIREAEIPRAADIINRRDQMNTEIVRSCLQKEIDPAYSAMAKELISSGITAEELAAALLQMRFGSRKLEVEEILPSPKKRKNHAVQDGDSQYVRVRINIGRSSRIAPNHIVGAITELTPLSGKEIGKIEIYDDETVVALPRANIQEVMDILDGCRINGRYTTAQIDTVSQKRQNGKGIKGSNRGSGHAKTDHRSGRRPEKHSGNRKNGKGCKA